MIVAGTVLRADVIGTNNRDLERRGRLRVNANRILADKPIATFKWAPGTSLMFAAAAIAARLLVVSLARHSHGVAQYSQLVTEFVTLVLVALLAWILAGRWAALIAVALMATYEPLIDVTRTYLSEPLGRAGADRAGGRGVLGAPARPARAAARRDRRRPRRPGARGLRDRRRA